MASQLMQNALRLARVTGELIKRAQLAKQAQEQQAASVASRVPATVEALLAGERIYPEQKEAVAKGLTNHGACLDMLAKLANHRNDSEVALGRTVQSQPAVKKASHVCGASVVDYDSTEAGRRFRDILLGSN
jgi:hypothetical protein